MPGIERHQTWAPESARARQRIQVGIADDHPIVRRTLRTLIESQPDMDVVGEACSGREAIELVRAKQVDVLLLDVHMPDQSGMDALTMITANSQRRTLAVLPLSGSAEQLFAVPLIRQGARGYLNKTCSPEELVAAVRHVADGRRWITPALAELLAQDAIDATLPEASRQRLSMRELQLLIKLARGRRTSQAAAELSLSPNAVSALRTGLLRKLQARSNSDLTHYAVKHRLLD